MQLRLALTLGTIVFLSKMKYVIVIILFFCYSCAQRSRVSKMIHNECKCKLQSSVRTTAGKHTHTETQVDRIWSSSLKERNTENSLIHKTHTHAHTQCLAFLALLLLRCSTNVILDMTPMFFPSSYMLRSSEHCVLLTRAKRKATVDVYVLRPGVC